VRRDEILARLNVKLPEAVSALAIPAIAVTLGLQSIRVLVPGLTWVLGDRFHLGAVQLGALAIVIFGMAFAAGPLRRRFSYRRVAGAALIALIAFRLAIQFWPGDPLLTLIIAALAVAAFVNFLPVYLDEVRHRDGAAVPLFAAGILSGLILDTLIAGAAGTYDLAWQPGLVTNLVSILLATALALLFFQDLRRPQASPAQGLRSRSGAWLAVGPFLFLELIILQNIPAQSALAGWNTGSTFLWLVATQLAGVIAAFYFHTQRDDTVYLATLFAAGILVTFAFFPFATGWLERGLLFLAQIAASQLFFAILMGMTNTHRGHTMNLSVANGIGMVLLVLLILGYYAAYQIALPYDNSMLIMLGAVLLAGGALSSLRYARLRLRISLKQWLAAGLACAVTLLTPVLAATGDVAPAVAEGSFPVRVMSYNLHNGFNAGGRLNLEALAREIEASGAGIVALQEVSRGWLVSGRVDMVEWLSRRLGMIYYFGPTAGPFWGNALLSRFPIVSATNIALPSEGLPIERRFISAVFDIDGQNIQVIALHLHHVVGDSEVRVDQLLALLDIAKLNRQTIVMGDFNAEPDSTEIGLMRGLGLADVLAAAPPPAYTFRSDDPYQRIDYIWVSSDLKFTAAEVFKSTASDHFGIAATIDD